MTPLGAQRPSVDRAFERLYRRHVGDVYRYALVLLRNPSDAEDVTQTTFMNAYRAFQRGQRPRTAQNWLIAIAHNVCRQRFRQSARRPQEVVFDDDVGEGVRDEERGPSAEDIQRALGHLAFNQRAALVMRELEGRSYNEIAEILGLSISAVETLLFRARRALREQLEGSLTCGDAELAISRQVDGRLAWSERGPLRAHLRECADCAHFARSQRAQRAAFKTLATLPLPASLGSFFGGGGAVVGTGVAAKVGAMLAAGAIVAGTSYEIADKGERPAADKAAPARAGTSARSAEMGGPSSIATARSTGAAIAKSGKQKTRRAQAKSLAKGQERVKPRGAPAKTKLVSDRGRRAGAKKPKHTSKASPVTRSAPPGQAKRSNAPPGHANGGNSGGGTEAAPGPKKPKTAVQVPSVPIPPVVEAPQPPGVKKPK